MKLSTVINCNLTCETIYFKSHNTHIKKLYTYRYSYNLNNSHWTFMKNINSPKFSRKKRLEKIPANLLEFAHPF